MTTFKASIAAVIFLGIGNATAYGDDIDAIGAPSTSGIIATWIAMDATKEYRIQSH